MSDNAKPGQKINLLCCQENETSNLMWEKNEMILIFLFHVKKFHLSHTAGCMTYFFSEKIVKVSRVRQMVWKIFMCARENRTGRLILIVSWGNQ